MKKMWVLSLLVSHFVPIPQREMFFYRWYIIGLTHSPTVYITANVFLPVSVSPADFAACQVGKALEKRESQRGYHQLWRRGEEFLVYLPSHCYKAVKESMILYFRNFHIWHFYPFVNWVFNRPCHLSPTAYSGAEHREADCFYKYFKWEGGDRLPPGHSPSRTQSGRCAALLSHPGRWRRLYDGSWCQRLWVWCGSQCWSRTCPGKQYIDMSQVPTNILY